jgi:hypothetical protein
MSWSPVRFILRALLRFIPSVFPGLSPGVFASTLFQNDRRSGPGPGIAELLTEDVGPVGIWRCLRNTQPAEPGHTLGPLVTFPFHILNSGPSPPLLTTLYYHASPLSQCLLPKRMVRVSSRASLSLGGCGHRRPGGDKRRGRYFKDAPSLQAE